MSISSYNYWLNQWLEAEGGTASYQSSDAHVMNLIHDLVVGGLLSGDPTEYACLAGIYEVVVGALPDAPSRNYLLFGICDAAGGTTAASASRAELARAISVVAPVIGGGPTVAVTAPNGGETWYPAESQNITWTSAGITNVKIEYSTTGAAPWTEIIASTAAAAGTYAWTIPDNASATTKVRVSDAVDESPADVSDANFTIGQPTITVTAPNGAETWYPAEVQNITWTSANLVGNVKLEYSTTGAAPWTEISASETNDGTYAWTVPDDASATTRVRISGVTVTSAEDTSNADFAIGQPTITVTAPNGSEVWGTGESQNITWNSANLQGLVKIEYSATGGAPWTSVATGEANDGTYSWSVPDVDSVAAKVQITGESVASATDVSDAAFTIGKIVVTAPATGNTWTHGGNQSIVWTKTSGIATVNLDLSKDGGSTFPDSITTAQAGTTYAWNPINANTPYTNADAVVRAKHPTSTVADNSDQFTLRGTLFQNLTEFWMLGEASGTRAGALGVHDLTDNNTVTQAAGFPSGGNAAQFVASPNQEYLSKANHADFEPGDTDFSVSLWFYLDAAAMGAVHYLMQVWGGVGARQWNVFKNTSDKVRLIISTDGTNVAATAEWATALLVSTWYHVVVWHDATANVIGITVNDGTPVTTAHTAGITQLGTPLFTLGGNPNAGVYSTGRIDAAGYWAKVLSAAEITALYAAGNGLGYPFSA